MTKKEVKDFMTRLAKYYPSFIMDDYKIQMWYDTLRDFDLEQVNKQLETHLKNEEFKDKEPSLNFLTRYLQPLTQVEDKYTRICKKCGRTYKGLTAFNEHYDDCVLIASIERDMKKYFNITISRNELETYDKQKLYRTYNKYIDRMLDSEQVPNERKTILKKCYIKEVMA